MSTDSFPSPQRGIVHGKTIRLDQDTGLPEGQEVSVTVKPVGATPEEGSAQDGILSSAGAWSEDAAELEQFLDWNRRQRKAGRPTVEE